MTTTDVIDMIIRIIGDETADLREQVQRLNHLAETVWPEVAQEPKVAVEPAEATAVEAARGDDYYERLEAIKALHTLRANPVTWTRDGSGKMVEAPPGLWEIECSACDHKTVWQEGGKKPPQCRTWLIAEGSSE